MMYAAAYFGKGGEKDDAKVHDLDQETQS